MAEEHILFRETILCQGILEAHLANDGAAAETGSCMRLLSLAVLSVHQLGEVSPRPWRAGI